MSAEQYITYFENLMIKFQNDVMDEYNNGTISKKEMKNILEWSRQAVETKKENSKRKTSLLHVEPDQPN